MTEEGSGDGFAELSSRKRGCRLPRAVEDCNRRSPNSKARLARSPVPHLKKRICENCGASGSFEVSSRSAFRSLKQGLPSRYAPSVLLRSLCGDRPLLPKAEECAQILCRNRLSRRCSFPSRDSPTAHQVSAGLLPTSAATKAG